MKRIFVLTIVYAAIASCNASKKTAPAPVNYGDNRTVEVELLNNQTYKLFQRTNDKTYGFSEQNPIKVGGKSDGPLNERRFLNALLGPKYETVSYERTGSCCSFKTPNGLLGNSGLLDRYKVYWKGGTDTVYLYLNMYDEGDLKIPVGFNAR